MLFSCKIKMKTLYAMASLSSLLVLAVAFWLEHNYMLAPCPLCTMQRLMLMISTLCFIILFFYNHKILQLPLLISSITGVILAARQVWLQSLPYNPGYGCSAGLAQLIHKYPILDFIKIIFEGSSDCSQVGYKILGLSLACWSLLVFIIISLLSIYQLGKKKGGF